MVSQQASLGHTICIREGNLNNFPPSYHYSLKLYGDPRGFNIRNLRIRIIYINENYKSLKFDLVVTWSLSGNFFELSFSPPQGA